MENQGRSNSSFISFLIAPIFFFFPFFLPTPCRQYRRTSVPPFPYPAAELRVRVNGNLFPLGEILFFLFSPPPLIRKNQLSLPSFLFDTFVKLQDFSRTLPCSPRSRFFFPPVELFQKRKLSTTPFFFSFFFHQDSQASPGVIEIFFPPSPQRFSDRTPFLFRSDRHCIRLL